MVFSMDMGIIMNEFNSSLDSIKIGKILRKFYFILFIALFVLSFHLFKQNFLLNPLRKAC